MSSDTEDSPDHGGGVQIGEDWLRLRLGSHARIKRVDPTCYQDNPTVSDLFGRATPDIDPIFVSFSAFSKVSETRKPNVTTLSRSMRKSGEKILRLGEVSLGDVELSEVFQSYAESGYGEWTIEDVQRVRLPNRRSFPYFSDFEGEGSWFHSVEISRERDVSLGREEEEVGEEMIPSCRPLLRLRLLLQTIGSNLFVHFRSSVFFICIVVDALHRRVISFVSEVGPGWQKIKIPKKPTLGLDRSDYVFPLKLIPILGLQTDVFGRQDVGDQDGVNGFQLRLSDRLDELREAGFDSVAAEIKTPNRVFDILPRDTTDVWAHDPFALPAFGKMVVREKYYLRNEKNRLYVPVQSGGKFVSFLIGKFDAIVNDPPYTFECSTTDELQHDLTMRERWLALSCWTSHSAPRVDDLDSCFKSSPHYFVDDEIWADFQVRTFRSKVREYPEKKTKLPEL